MLSCSKVYKNIAFVQLADLLGIDARRAERVAARMITEQRMNGSIDQLDEIIYFMDTDTISHLDGKESRALSKHSVVSEAMQWDSVIQDICNSVNKIIEEMQERRVPAAMEIA